MFSMVLAWAGPGQAQAQPRPGPAQAQAQPKTLQNIGKLENLNKIWKLLEIIGNYWKIEGFPIFFDKKIGKPTVFHHFPCG